MPDSGYDQTSTPSAVLRLSGIAKRYGGVVALQDVDFSARANSIHAVLGENGAGKSTLIKIVAGVVHPDAGTMMIDQRTVRLSSPGDAVRAGVVSVFQELSLVPDLTVAENICIAPAPGRFGFIDKRAQRRRAEELLARVGCEDVNPRLPVRELPLSRRQLVELAKALGRRPRILILDEATSALTARHVETVNQILRQLRDQGLTILLISHRMHEIDALADTCSVFRGGHHIETYAQGSRTPGDVLRLMIGREISQVYPPKPGRPCDSPAALQVDRLSWGERLHDLSFRVGRGEIVGLGGLDGQGQRTVLLALFGVLRDVKGKVLIDGKPVVIDSPAAAKTAGLDLALVPDDRKSEGLMLSMSVRENVTLAALDRLTRGPFVDQQRERHAVDEAINTLGISVPSPEHPVGALSGGNQQKVVLAKWLMNRPRLILLMDPTRGIDVGTKQEFYRIMRDLAAQGIGILFYSTDYDEIIGMCDRVLILYGGRIVSELSGTEITESGIVGASFNLSLDATVA
jgi:ribose transport system ATP-binding protein